MYMREQKGYEVKTEAFCCTTQSLFLILFEM